MLILSIGNRSYLDKLMNLDIQRRYLDYYLKKTCGLTNLMSPSSIADYPRLVK